MSTPREDMSNTCGMEYDSMWRKLNIEHTISQEEFDKWFKEHCAKCRYMSEVCMYGEK